MELDVAVFSQSFRSFVLDPFQPPPSLARLPPDLFSAPGGVRPGLQNAVAHTSKRVSLLSERIVVWDSQIFVIIFGKQNRANYH